MSENQLNQNDSNNSESKIDTIAGETVTEQPSIESNENTWKESLTDKFDESTDTENMNKIQSFTGYHLQFKTWKKEK